MSRQRPTYDEKKGLDRGRKGKYQHSLVDLLLATNKTLAEQSRGARWGRQERRRRKR